MHGHVVFVFIPHSRQPSLTTPRQAQYSVPEEVVAHLLSVQIINSMWVGLINCSSGNDHEFPLAKLAVVALAAGVLALGSAHEAMAAKSGGRVGGQAFRSAAPKSSGPRINNSRTNIYVNPPVAPPLVGGYGYGYGVPFYGGWGWSPFSFFAPGPSVAVGFGGGLELFAAMFAFAALAAVVRRFSRGGDEDDD